MVKQNNLNAGYKISRQINFIIFIIKPKNNIVNAGKNLPIGYWIKKADELLTTKINAVQAQFGLSRTSWQVLHSLYEERQMQQSEIVNLLQSFAGEQAISAVLIQFKKDELITEKNNQFFLTEKGTQLHTTCFNEQKLLRQKMMIGISEQDYQQTIFTLQKVIDNLSS